MLTGRNDSIRAETLLFPSNGLNDEDNAWIIKSTIEYIITTERKVNKSIVMKPFKQITTSIEICNSF